MLVTTDQLPRGCHQERPVPRDLLERVDAAGERIQGLLSRLIDEGQLQDRAVRAISEGLSRRIIWFGPGADTARFSACRIAPVSAAGERLGVVAFADEREPCREETLALRQLARQTALLLIAHRQDQRAHTDSLTGLPNRRALDHSLIAEVSRARRYGRRLSVALLDLDRFKQVNDRFGHTVGDVTLQRCARIFFGHVRDEDILARFGGEEFCWLMPEVRERKAQRAAERLRQEIADHDFDPVGLLTVSVGVAELRPDEDPHSLLQRVDRLLYRAKEAGRNRVVCSAALAV